MVRLSEYDFIGFDLDHTLIQYRLDNLYQLVYESFIQFLVKEKGYDTCLLDIDFKDLKDFCLKGLVLDTRKGNFLKLRNDGFIIRASHGTRQLTRRNIIEQYGDTSTWPEFPSLKDNPVQQSSDFRVFDNYFDLPVAAVCACVVDVIDQKVGRPEKYSFWPDIISTLLFIFNPSSFADQKGNFFPSITKDTAKFVKPCSKDVVDWIKCLRNGKRKVFLLTNSYIDYTTLLLNYAVGRDWADMFDVVICMAGKPGFFKQGNSNQFHELDGKNDIGVVQELQEKKNYSHGNIKDFTRFLQKCTGKEDPTVLYFGDSLKSDLYPCVQFGKWNVVAVLEEMESEGMVMNLGAIHDKNSAEDRPTPKRARHMDIEIEKEKEGVLLSCQWGSLFIDDSTEKSTSPGRRVADGDQQLKGTANAIAVCSQSGTQRSPMDSFWGYIIQRYSSVAIPRLDFITGVEYSYPQSSVLSLGRRRANIFSKR